MNLDSVASGRVFGHYRFFIQNEFDNRGRIRHGCEGTKQ